MIIGDYLTQSELLRRGWSAAKITALLGKPDKYLPPLQEGRRWMKGYHRDRITAAEKGGQCYKRGINPNTHDPDNAAAAARQDQHHRNAAADEEEARRFAEYAANNSF